MCITLVLYYPELTNVPMKCLSETELISRDVSKQPSHICHLPGDGAGAGDGAGNTTPKTDTNPDCADNDADLLGPCRSVAPDHPCTCAKLQVLCEDTSAVPTKLQAMLPSDADTQGKAVQHFCPRTCGKCDTPEEDSCTDDMIKTSYTACLADEQCVWCTTAEDSTGLITYEPLLRECLAENRLYRKLFACTDPTSPSEACRLQRKTCANTVECDDCFAMIMLDSENGANKCSASALELQSALYDEGACITLSNPPLTTPKTPTEDATGATGSGVDGDETEQQGKNNGAATAATGMGNLTPLAWGSMFCLFLID
jgi:hypothetical protein